MDIDEWEFLSDDGFLDFNEDGEKQISPGKRSLESKSAFANSPSSRKIPEPPRNPRVHNQLIPLQILLEPKIGKTPDDGLVKEITKTRPLEADQETVSQVFFKIKENEFVDMKMDSPKSSSLKFEDKGEAMEIITSPRMKIEKEKLSMECDKVEDSTWEEENTGGFNMWKWKTRVGAICSFGIAAATVCILFFGSRQRNKLQQDQKIRFQIYTDDKRIKQVVQHATKLNEAISGIRGVPISRAHITVGGYHDGL